MLLVPARKDGNRRDAVAATAVTGLLGWLGPPSLARREYSGLAWCVILPPATGGGRVLAGSFAPPMRSYNLPMRISLCVCATPTSPPRYVHSRICVWRSMCELVEGQGTTLSCIAPSFSPLPGPSFLSCFPAAGAPFSVNALPP